MISRTVTRSLRRIPIATSHPIPGFSSYRTRTRLSRSKQANTLPRSISSRCQYQSLTSSSFHTSASQNAQSPTADALMESLNELYGTARDEFEIAAEETEKKTVYAADDREAAVDALNTLKDSFEKALKETSPEVSKEIQGRVGQRIRELENAVKAMEEMAMED